MASSAERKTAAPWRKFENFEFVTFLCNYPPLSSVDNHCQTVWTQIRPDKTSGLIWFQTV